MKRFLMVAAAVAGISLTGLTGESQAGSCGPSRGYNSYGFGVGVGSFGMGGYGGYGMGGYGGGYRVPPMAHCGPRMPVRRFNNCNHHAPGFGYGYGYGVNGYRW